MFFDLLRFFRENNIRHEEAGKNISPGWVGVYNCPFCGDRSTHLGFNLNTGNFSCFTCKAKGWVYDYLERAQGLDRAQARIMCRPYFTGAPSDSVRLHRAYAGTVDLPPGATKDFTPPFLEYLNGRNYGEEVITRYDLFCGGWSGPFKYRLLIPVYYQERLVNYLGRDITGQLEARYRNCKNDLCVVPSKSCVYNIDQAGKKVIIVEGPTDVWRMGTGSICTLGTTFTNDQIHVIKKAGITHAATLFDPGPKSQALANQLATSMDLVGIQSFVYTMDGDTDPGGLSDDAAFSIRREIMDFIG